MTIGHLRLTPAGKWATTAPSHCANGHWLGPQRVLVGHVACDCDRRGGHMTWFCLDCGDVVYGPPLGDTCRTHTGPDER